MSQNSVSMNDNENKGKKKKKDNCETRNNTYKHTTLFFFIYINNISFKCLPMDKCAYV